MRNRPLLAAFIKIGVPFLVLVAALVIFLAVTAVRSHNLNAKRQVLTCTITRQPARRTLRDEATPSWRVYTSCGGTLYIDPDATNQTSADATVLVNSLRVGGKYRLTIQGQLGNKADISSYLLAATPTS